MVDRGYIEKENRAYRSLMEKGYTPQGADRDLRTVCVMRFEHPEFYGNPARLGQCEVYHFRNWQEADAQLN